MMGNTLFLSISLACFTAAGIILAAYRRWLRRGRV